MLVLLSQPLRQGLFSRHRTMPSSSQTAELGGKWQRLLPPERNRTSVGPPQCQTPRRSPFSTGDTTLAHSRTQLLFSRLPLWKLSDPFRGYQSSAEPRGGKVPLSALAPHPTQTQASALPSIPITGCPVPWPGPVTVQRQSGGSR